MSEGMTEHDRCDEGACKGCLELTACVVEAIGLDGWDLEHARQFATTTVEAFDTPPQQFATDDDKLLYGITSLVSEAVGQFQRHATYLVGGEGLAKALAEALDAITEYRDVTVCWQK